MQRREFITGMCGVAAWPDALGLTLPTVLLVRADEVIE
jgi:hypothetical protein